MEEEDEWKRRPKKERINPTSGTGLEDMGPVWKPGPLYWLSDGPLTKLEKGLPLLTGNGFNHPSKKVEHIEERLKSMEEEALRLRDPNDYALKDILAQQKAEELEHKRQVEEQRRKLHELRMSQKTQLLSASGVDVVENIGEINLRTVQKLKPCPPGVNPFALVSLPPPPPKPQFTSQIVQEGIKTAGTIKASDDDFPMALLYNEDIAKIDTKHAVQVTTIDNSDKQLFWLPGNIPFTRHDIDVLYTWRQQGIQQVIDEQKKASDRLQKRKQCLKDSLQSKKALRKQIDMIHEEIDSLQAGYGKGIKRKTSIWNIAAKEAVKDTESLYYRRQVWANFAKRVKERGGPEVGPSLDLCKAFRTSLITAPNIDNRFALEFFDEVNEHCFMSPDSGWVLDIVRETFDVSKQEMIEYLEKREIPIVLYERSKDKPHVEIEDHRNSEIFEKRFTSLANYREWRRQVKANEKRRLQNRPRRCVDCY